MQTRRKRSTQEIREGLKKFLDNYMMQGMTFTTKDILQHTHMDWANPEHRILEKCVRKGLLLKGYVHTGGGNGGRGRGSNRLVAYTVNTDDVNLYNAILEDYKHGKRLAVPQQKPEPQRAQETSSEDKCPKCGFNITRYRNGMATLLKECGG